MADAPDDPNRDPAQTRARRSGARPPARRSSRKVPEITVAFWVVKVLTTAMGEATSDFLVRRFDPYVAVVLGVLALTGALALQFRTRRYVPAVYWLAVVMVAVTGTMAADVLHIQFGVPYLASTSLFAIVLAVVFATWRRTEGTLSIHSIVAARREAFYWATVMATFALGTATGDLTATTFGLGYLASGVMFAALIALPGIAYRLRMVGEVAAFWWAYVLTRPLGASFADWAGKSHAVGGIGLGDGNVALVLSAVIVALVGSMSLPSRSRVRVAPLVRGGGPA